MAWRGTRTECIETSLNSKYLESDCFGEPFCYIKVAGCVWSRGIDPNFEDL